MVTIRAIVSAAMSRFDRPWTRVAAALVAVAVVSGFAIVANLDETSAALLLLVNVLIVGSLGIAADITAALAGFLALYWYFTEPPRSFTIQRAGDVVTLVLFVISAAFVGWRVRRLQVLREDAQRREQETRVRLELTNRLLAGANADDALQRTADALRTLFAFDDCVLVTGEPPPPRAGEVRVDAPGVTLIAHGEHDLASGDRELLEALVAGSATSIDRLRLKEEVREARMSAELSRQRAGFLSAISHNLRTPLTAIKAAGSTLLASWSHIPSDERRELLETICDEAERLERLVRNTLELSRIRAGALEIEPEDVDVADLVQHAVRRLRPITRAHRVRMDVADDLPPAALDVMAGEQILLNLLENALRFAPPGSEILVGARRVDHTGVELRVSDHGPGVPVEARDRIFEEFQSADTRPDRTGTGLGLAIVRALVLAHGGSVRYEDTPGGGATFVCTLPSGTDPLEPGPS